MGNLKPGANYVYEKADGVTYAREFNAPAEERFPIGWDYKPGITSAQKELAEHNEWIKIRLEAKKNPALLKAVEQVQMLYRLCVEKYD